MFGWKIKEWYAQRLPNFRIETGVSGEFLKNIGSECRDYCLRQNETIIFVVMERPFLSIIVPVFHSEALLEGLYAQILAAMNDLGKTWEIIFVEDGGKDGSWKKLTELKEKDPDHITIIQLSRNFGQHIATMCGFFHSQGDWVVTIDDDLQTPPEEIAKLLQKQADTGATVIYGVYKNKQHSFFRNLGSKALRAVFRYLVDGLPDGSSFRLISREVIDLIKEHNQHFMIIDQVILWHTLDINFVEVSHAKREVGKSGYSAWKLFRMAAKLILHYTDIPLRMMIRLGFLSSAGSFAFGVYYLFRKINIGADPGYSSIIVSIFFATGLILMCVGIVGEYVGRIYKDKSGRPMYSVRKKI